jgi:hypothetical protein
LLFAGSAVATVRGQTIAGPDVFAEVGLASDGRESARAAAWFAGASIASAPVSLGRHWDVTATGGIAREPVAAMARGAEGIVPAYFDAVRVSASLSFVHAAGAFDVEIVGRYAETRLDPAQQLPSAENDNGLWTFLFDAASHLRWYAPRDRRVPAGRRRLAPLVDVFGGIRHDRRFHRAGDLAPYDDPTGRVFGGLTVGVWYWRDSDGAPRLAVRAGAEFETALRSGVRLPSTGRIFVVGDIDVRRLARPGNKS